MGEYRTRRHPVLVLYVWICLLLSQPVIASQKAYIEAIEADVDEFSSGTFTAPADSSWTGLDSTGAGMSQKNTETLESFSEFLKQASPGSYIFYVKLPPALQRKILEEYRTLGDLERTKKTILNFSDKRRR